jgi:hypothetical protein
MNFVIYHLYPSKPVLQCTLCRGHICDLSFCAVSRFPSSNNFYDVQTARGPRF